MSTPAATHLGTVLGIWAHPDDEAYLAGGLMARASDAGERVFCITATRGERGTSDAVAWPPERLAALREHELRASLAVLGVEGHQFLDIPDGGCGAQDDQAVVNKLCTVIERVRPTTVVTFGPDGYTGHEDHRTVSRWATVASRRAAHGARLLYATCTAERSRRWHEVHQQLSVFLAPGLPLRTPASEVAVEVRLDEHEADRKLAALRAQASQTAPLVAQLGENRFRDWCSVESFVDAGTARPSPAFGAATRAAP